MLERLRDGKTGVGTLIFSQDPSITEIAATAGFDVCVIDLEHAANTVGDFLNHARAAQFVGRSCWARVGENNPSQIGRLLDAGAQGIILPHFGLDVTSSQALDALRYAPAGRRPTCTGVRATGYGHLNFTEYAAASNEEVLSIGLVEDAEVVERIDEVLQGTSLKAVMPGGAGDLAASLGVPGESQNPRVLAAISKVVAAARRKPGLKVGVYISDLGSIAKMKELHADFYVYSIDFKIIYNCFKDASTSIREGLR
jgi:2-keto-3-deoxy-L-rhamnonate aldolase RhmA